MRWEVAGMKFTRKLSCICHFRQRKLKTLRLQLLATAAPWALRL